MEAVIMPFCRRRYYALIDSGVDCGITNPRSYACHAVVIAVSHVYVASPSPGSTTAVAAAAFHCPWGPGFPPGRFVGSWG